MIFCLQYIPTDAGNQGQAQSQRHSVFASALALDLAALMGYLATKNTYTEDYGEE
jgi:hypothetical protein